MRSVLQEEAGVHCVGSVVGTRRLYRSVMLSWSCGTGCAEGYGDASVYRVEITLCPIENLDNSSG